MSNNKRVRLKNQVKLEKQLCKLDEENNQKIRVVVESWMGDILRKEASMKRQETIRREWELKKAMNKAMLRIDEINIRLRTSILHSWVRVNSILSHKNINEIKDIINRLIWVRKRVINSWKKERQIGLELINGCRAGFLFYIDSVSTAQGINEIWLEDVINNKELIKEWRKTNEYTKTDINKKENRINTNTWPCNCSKLVVTHTQVLHRRRLLAKEKDELIIKGSIFISKIETMTNKASIDLQTNIKNEGEVVKTWIQWSNQLMKIINRGRQIINSLKRLGSIS